MEKLKNTQFYIYMLVSAMSLGVLGCGDSKKSKHHQGQIESPQSDKPKNAIPDDQSSKPAKGTSGPHQSQDQDQKQPDQAAPSEDPVGGSSDEKPSDSGQASEPIEGTYLQVDNQQARVVIDANLLLTTNLEFPSPSGNGTRLTPSFPQGLKAQKTPGEYKSIGTYNDGTGVFKNIEIRVRLYGQNKLLDVTLVTPPTLSNVSDASTGAGSDDSSGTSGTASKKLETDEFNAFFVIPIISFCPPLPRVPPCLPPSSPRPPSCPNPCPPRDQTFYVYRFERA